MAAPDQTKPGLSAGRVEIVDRVQHAHLAACKALFNHARLHFFARQVERSREMRLGRQAGLAHQRGSWKESELGRQVQDRFA